MTSRLLAAATLVVAAAALPAADWPQWRGPHRDGRSADTGLIRDWPANGPRLVWTFREAGLGYSGPAIVGDTLYAMGADEDTDKEFVFAVNVGTGALKWKTPVPILKRTPDFNANWGGGPRSTPTVDGDRIYVLGAQGDLACLTTAGKVVWHKSLTKDLGGKIMVIWGFAESPLVDGDLVICSPGYDAKGDGQGAIAALDKMTGNVKWQCKELTDEAAYSSAVVTEAGGVRQYVQMTGGAGVAGVRASDGKLLWRAKVGGNRTATIPTPVVSGDFVYVTSDYGAGCGLLRLSRDGDGVKAEQVYANKVMQNHHGGVILNDGAIFGASGSASGKSRLPFVCQDLEKGEAVWTEPKTLEPSSIVYADGSFYCYGQNTGTVVRINASRDGYKETGRFTIPQTSKLMKPQGGIWTHPVIANGRLYLRDQELLYCYDLSGARAD